MRLPFENHTEKTIRRLTRRSLQASPMKTALTLVAIVLSVGLLTGLILSQTGIRTAEQRELDTRQHVIYENISEDTAGAIAQDGRVSDSLRYKQGAYTMEVEDYLLALGCFGQESREIAEVDLAEGTYPQGLHEAAVDRAYLEKLGLEAKPGQTFSVTWLDGTVETFTVTGLTDLGNTGANVYGLYVSEQYARAGSQLKDQPWNLAVRICDADSMDVEEFRAAIRDLGTDYGVPRAQINELNAYVSAKSMTREELLLYFLVGFGVLFVSVLVIYNVFYISVVGRIRQFGQMRTLGATVKQIRQMVRREGQLLCCMGAPVGIAIGALAAYFVAPVGWSWRNLLLVAAIVFLADYVTVRISIRTPAKLAAAVSPVEAVRASAGTAQVPAARKLHRHLTPLRLAWMGIARNKKAAAVTVLSLGVSGVLFLAGFTLLSSATAETYARQGPLALGEAVIYLSSNAAEQDPHGYAGLQAAGPMDRALEEKLLAMDGVTGVQRMEQLIVNYIYNNSSGTDSCKVVARADWDRIMAYADRPISYDEAVDQGAVAFEDNDVAEEIYGWRFAEGDDLEIQWYDGAETRSGTLALACEIGKGIHRKEADYDLNVEAGVFFIPEDLARSMVSEGFDLTEALVVKTNYERLGHGPSRQVSALLEGYPTLKCMTLEENIQRGQQVFDTLYLVILGLCLFVIGFSLMNLLNTMITSVVTRRQEFTMLRSVGMTQKQLSAAIRDEGLIYSGFNLFIAAGVGTTVGYLLVYLLRRTGAFYFHWSFPGWYLLGYGLLTALLPMAIAAPAARSIQGRNLAEQLRNLAS